MPGRPNGENTHPAALAVTLYEELTELPPKGWLIKGVIARGEISSWIGPPGGAKSSLLIDLAVHAAAGLDWRSHPSKGPTGVVYFALERAGLVKRRLYAYRLRDGLTSPLPIAICSRVIDLMSSSCVEAIVDTVRACEEAFGMRVGLVILDTANKGIAQGGGDEDKAKDQNRVNAHLRVILERLDLHIASIGHTGKDPERGERGSNAKVADVDLQVTISGDAVRTATIDKANDQPEGKLTTYSLQSVVLGLDEDGEEVKTGIVDKLTPAKSDTPKATKSRPFVEILQEQILMTYERLADDEGLHAAGKDGKPVIKVSADRIRDELKERGFLDLNERRTGLSPTARSCLRTAKARVLNAGKLVEDGGFIWRP
jgi:RecA-family ATPase